MPLMPNLKMMLEPVGAFAEKIIDKLTIMLLTRPNDVDCVGGLNSGTLHMDDMKHKEMLTALEMIAYELRFMENWVNANQNPSFKRRMEFSDHINNCRQQVMASIARAKNTEKAGE